VPQSRKAALLAALAALFAVYLIGSSKSFQDCINQRKNHQAYHALHEKGPLLVKTIVRVELHAACARVTSSENDGALTALATIVVAFFTFTLWRSTTDMMRVTEKLERPHLYISRVFFDDDEKPIRTFRAEIQNGGRSAAYYRMAQADLFISQTPPRPFVKPDDDSGFGTVIRSNLTTYMPNKFSESEIAEVTSGRARLFYQICIVYAGTSGEEYSTHQCFAFDAAMNGFGPYGGISQNWFT
jgi:hypothetical protein